MKTAADYQVDLNRFQGPARELARAHNDFVEDLFGGPPRFDGEKVAEEDPAPATDPGPIE